MPRLDLATALRYGSVSVLRAYYGGKQVWSPAAPPAPTPNTPASLLDLHRMHLTLPTGTGNTPTQVEQPALATYTGPNFYFENDRVVFRAPEQGVTTSSASGAARCELRERDESTYANASWSPGDGRRRALGGTMRVDATGCTDRQEVIVGQIHSGTDVPPIYVVVEQLPGKTPRLRLFVNGPGYADLLTGITPTTVFSYDIVCPGDGTVAVYAKLGTGSTLSTTPVVVPAGAFDGDTSGWYFKAGIYNKSKIADGGSGFSIAYWSDLRMPLPGAAAGTGTGTGTNTGTGTSGGSTAAVGYGRTFLDGTAYPTFGAATRAVSVSTSAQLTSALAGAAAGDKIVLASGNYSGTFALSGKAGTASAGISVQAATDGGAVFAAGSTLTLKDSSHVTVSGLVFPTDESVVTLRGASHHVRLTRCTIGPTALTPSDAAGILYVYVGDDCSYIRVDHCWLRNKGSSGNMIRVYGNFTTYQVCQYVLVDHNLFDGSAPEVGNDKEPVRFGVSGMSRSDALGVVERNHVTRVVSEPEVISIKAGRVRVSGNTIYRCAGGIVVRHGRGSLVTDNYLVDDASTTASNGLQSGGVRFYDSGHTVEYNYMGGLIGVNYQASILVDTGDASGSSSSLNAHWQVLDAVVQRNLIVGCKTAVQVGDNYSLAPSNVKIADNVSAEITDTAPVKYVGGTALGGSSSVSGNTHYASTTAAGAKRDADGVWRLSGYGPRSGYLTSGAVGPKADLNDADGIGTTSSGTGTGTTTGTGTETTTGTGTTTGTNTGTGTGTSTGATDAAYGVPSDNPYMDWTLWSITEPPSGSELRGLVKRDDRPYFTVGPDKHSIQFEVNSSGATTTNTSYPRSELREYYPDANTKAAWSLTSGSHTLVCRTSVSVMTATVKPQTVVGQIHNATDDVIEILWDGLASGITAGKSAALGVRLNGATQSTYLSKGLALGELFDYAIDVPGDGTIDIYFKADLSRDFAAGDLVLHFTTAQVNNGIASTTGMYFKAGNYFQTNPSKGDSNKLCDVQMIAAVCGHAATRSSSKAPIKVLTTWPTSTGGVGGTGGVSSTIDPDATGAFDPDAPLGSAYLKRADGSSILNSQIPRNAQVLSLGSQEGTVTALRIYARGILVGSSINSDSATCDFSKVSAGSAVVTANYTFGGTTARTGNKNVTVVEA